MKNEKFGKEKSKLRK